MKNTMSPKEDSIKKEKLNKIPECNTKFSIDMDVSKESKYLKRWEECKFSEKNIHQRSYHSAVIYNDNLFVYGGYEINKGIMNDFYGLDLENKECFTWKNLSKKNNNSVYPESLHRHSAIVYKDKMYLYGGKTSIFTNTNKFFSYDFIKCEWELLNQEKERTYEGFKLPFYLDSHNAVLYENSNTNSSQMVVFGGFIGGENAQYSKSIVYYDFTKNEWDYYFLQSKKKAKE